MILSSFLYSYSPGCESCLKYFLKLSQTLLMLQMENTMFYPMVIFWCIVFRTTTTNSKGTDAGQCTNLRAKWWPLESLTSGRAVSSVHFSRYEVYTFCQRSYLTSGFSFDFFRYVILREKIGNCKKNLYEISINQTTLYKSCSLSNLVI